MRKFHPKSKLNATFDGTTWNAELVCPDVFHHNTILWKVYFAEGNSLLEVVASLLKQREEIMSVTIDARA